MNRPERTVDGGIGSGGRISHGGASGGRSPGRHTTRLEVLRVDPKQIRQDIVVNPKYTVGAMSKLDYPVDQVIVAVVQIRTFVVQMSLYGEHLGTYTIEMLSLRLVLCPR